MVDFFFEFLERLAALGERFEFLERLAALGERLEFFFKVGTHA